MHSLFTAYLIGCLFGLSLTVIWVGIVLFFSFLRSHNDAIRPTTLEKGQQRINKSKVTLAKGSEKLKANYHDN